MNGAPGCLQPWPFRTTTMSHLVIVSALAFRLHAHVPPKSLMVSLGFGVLAPLPWRALG
jgi:hypothetical protein